MGVRRGLEAKLYRNTASHEAPTWEEITNVRDLTLALEKDEADATTRANNGFKATVGTLKDASLEFDMVWDDDDDGFTVLQGKFFDDTSVELAVMNGAIEEAGTQGLIATFTVLKFSEPQELAGVITVSVTVKPTYSAHPPQWHTVGAS